jgi:16S rRNA (uracil1498-N3)-methyltransferase
MARRYLVRPLPPQGASSLPPDVAHHLGVVLRVRVDDEITLFDGSGNECVARVRAVRRGAVDVECGPPHPGHVDATVRVEVAFALPKGARGEWVFEHGTEVGIATFRPLVTARSTERAGDADTTANRVARWERIVAAAAGQCDRASVPIVVPPEPLARLVARDDLPTERYVATRAAAPLSSAQSSSALLLVGPEGGWTEAELALVRDAGFVPRHLGALTLRTETAVLAGAIRLLRDDAAHGSPWSDASAKL